MDLSPTQTLALQIAPKPFNLCEIELYSYSTPNKPKIPDLQISSQEILNLGVIKHKFRLTKKGSEFGEKTFTQNSSVSSTQFINIKNNLLHMIFKLRNEKS